MLRAIFATRSVANKKVFLQNIPEIKSSIYAQGFHHHIASRVTSESQSLQIWESRRWLSQSRCVYDKKDNSKGRDGEERQKEDYIDENPELQKILRDLYSEPSVNEDEPKAQGTVDQEDPKILGSLSYQNFKYFDDSESRIIYDIEEERQLGIEAVQQEKEHIQKRFKGLDTSRGKEGVFELDQLVDLLRRENCCDICVIAIPKENSYVNQIVIGTCTSTRHLMAVSDFVKKVFKMKQNPEDPVPDFEGRGRQANWIAADLGNIAIHLFLQETRELYDLESLWALGPEFDEQSQAKPDDADEIFYGLLSDLKPAQTKEQPSEDLKPSKTKETGVAKR